MELKYLIHLLFLTYCQKMLQITSGMCNVQGNVYFAIMPHCFLCNRKLIYSLDQILAIALRIFEWDQQKSNWLSIQYRLKAAVGEDC